jgi:hypothetical protein
MNADDVARANASARSTGFGEHALVPRYVLGRARPGDLLLDFGAGPEAIHTALLRAAGLQVVAHDFGANVREGVHDPDALTRRYNGVFASNVLNVQPSTIELQGLLRLLASVLHPTGWLIANYPAPRYSGAAPGVVAACLKASFRSLERIGGTPSAPIWMAHGRRR